MTSGNFQRISGLALAVAVALAFAPAAQAQITPTPATSICGSTAPGLVGGTDDPICTEESGSPYVAVGETKCGWERGGTNCTANEFVGNASVISNTITSCHQGDSLPGQSLTFTIKSSSADRYAVGLFISETGVTLNQPTVSPNTCTAITFPTTSTGTVADPTARNPFPWNAANTGDICGSYTKDFESVEQVDGVTLKCVADPSGNLAINYMVTYNQNSGGALGCTGAAYDNGNGVSVGTGSKCSFNSVGVSNVVVTHNADPACSGKTVVFDAVAQTVTSQFTLVNNPGQLALSADVADGTTFTDVVPGPVVVRSVQSGGVTCTSADGATCDLTGTSGNNIAGTITSFPSGSHVTVTIVGDVSNPPASLYTNTADVQPPANLTSGADNITNNSCQNSAQLPVKLQSFDVE